MDPQSIEFSEITRSQLPALHLLQNLGYTYLSLCKSLVLGAHVAPRKPYRCDQIGD
jgi:hypothetical protein